MSTVTLKSAVKVVLGKKMPTQSYGILTKALPSWDTWKDGNVLFRPSGLGSNFIVNLTNGESCSADNHLIFVELLQPTTQIEIIV